MNGSLKAVRRWIVVVLLGLVAFAYPVPAVRAHTAPDLVAIAASEEATLVFRPTHGCDDAATIEVSIRAPLEGAVAGSVEGWDETSTSDGLGNTVLTWSEGVLASDTPGEFPVSFMVPDAVGELLIFPAVQVCENEEELAWIGGDPEGEYPAPRILILPEGSPPAATIDDVPLDAPGRDQLVGIVDVDNPDSTTTSTPESTSTTVTTATTASTSTIATTSTTLPASTTSAPLQESEAIGPDEEEQASPGIAIVVGLGVAVLVVGTISFLTVRRRNAAR